VAENNSFLVAENQRYRLYSQNCKNCQAKTRRYMAIYF